MLQLVMMVVNPRLDSDECVLSFNKFSWVKTIIKCYGSVRLEDWFKVN